MVTSALVDAQIRSGRDLVEALDAEGLPLPAAFWVVADSESSPRWKLVIASPLVESEGSRKVYQRIQKVLSRLPASSLDFREITAARPNDLIVRLISKLVHTGPEISGVRLQGNVVDGTLIDDAYIYRAA